MQDTGVSEHLIENVMGCGLFQGLMVFMVCLLTKVPVVYTFMFMSFGNYNPGWRCLDKFINSTSSSNLTESHDHHNDSQPVYEIGTCSDYEACQHVEFHPDHSTIVTEWGLVCNLKWIPALIISIQMAGALCGSYVAGQCSDSFGRKKTIYGSIALLAVLNFTSIFATSWPVFAAHRFFLGGGAGSVLAVYYVLTAEFLTIKWRAPLSSIPAWNVSAVVFSITAMILRDWKHLHLATGIISIFSLLPAIWVPESLRWLEVKNKTTKFMRVANKMAKTNNKEVPEFTRENLMANANKALESKQERKTYTPLDLFHRGYKLYTVLVGILWVFMSLIYYAITFGVKAMYGNFYINLILVFVAQFPFAIFPIIIPNLLGRQRGSLIFLAISAIGLVAATMFDRLSTGSVREIGSLVMIMFGKVGMSSGWDINKVHLTEIYPTVIRGMSLGWACFMARIGGIIAPFLIPNDPESIYICYGVMAFLGMTCCLIVLKLPETKGRPLKETFTDDSDESEESTELEEKA